MERTKPVTDFAGRSVNSQSQHWCTPPKYVDAVKKVFGGEIELDPCSNKDSIVHAKTEFLLPETDGLNKAWDFKTVYVNPPPLRLGQRTGNNHKGLAFKMRLFPQSAWCGGNRPCARGDKHNPLERICVRRGRCGLFFI